MNEEISALRRLVQQLKSERDEARAVAQDLKDSIDTAIVSLETEEICEAHVSLRDAQHDAATKLKRWSKP